MPSELSPAAWRRVARQLIAAGYLTTDADGFGSLKLASASAGVLKGERSVALRRDPEPVRQAGRTARKRPDLPRGPEGELSEELRRVRSELARAQGVPAYVVFHDATLREMAERRPRSLAQLSGVSGVGAKKLERYGEEFLRAVRAFLDDS